MSYHRVLTDEQILEAKTLREQLGYTKRQLAETFGVGSTTIWNNLYGRKRKTKKIYLYRRKHEDFNFTNIQGFVIIVENLRNEGMTSGDIADIFQVPLKEINQIWKKTL